MQLAEQSLRPLRILRDHVVGRLQLHRHAREGRPQPVVQVAPHPTAFFLASTHQSFTRSLQLTVGRDRLDHGAHLSPDVLEQTAVPRPERLS